MGMIDDAVTAISDWFKDLLAGGITSSLNTANSMLGSTLNGKNGKGINGIFAQYLGNPVDFTGGGTSAVWTTIKTLTNNVIVPIGGFILCVIVLVEFINMIVNSNNFRDFDSSVFIRWILKTVCGIILVANVFYIATGLFSLGTQSVTHGLNTLFPTNGGGIVPDDLVNSSTFHDTLVRQSVGTLIVTLLQAFILIIVTFILLASIIIVLANRIIEVFMYLSISPIPMATMMGSGWNDIGKNWFKNILALAFQGFFIIVALGIFRTLFNNALVSMVNSNSSSVSMTMATLLGFSIALIFTMFRTSSISKSVFSAH